ncbi:MAG: hypothetical protein IAE77_12190 [Prosthecobacter sp.]|jgi:hypothetical protein|uniref:PTPDL family protein n=1 Tax=Prosthecobacter sp. TaxID=1965333 RepID=UPI0019F70746|nr:PTPDL family protein [Prosthecobacter sp.]MBE2284207.1 hypothetical protein [Prosthecobacter sp.]
MKLSRFRPVLIALACSAGFLHADIVVLKDGKRLEGSITAENPQSIHMRYKLTPKIWDDKDIPRTEIAEIIKQKPEEVELIELKKLFPTVDLMTAVKYEQLIQDRLRPFVNRYPGTKEAAEVEKLIAQVQEEKEKVVAGGIKMEGKWLTPDEAKAESYNIKAYAARAAMLEKAEAKDYSGALKEFDKLANPQTGYVASIHYPKAVEEILAVLTKYEAQIEQMIKDQPTLQKLRDENTKKLIEPDLTRVKDAITREKEQWKTTYDLERKSGKWFTPYKYDLPSLKALSTAIVTEKNRLQGLDLASITKANDAIARIMRADAKAGKDAAELKTMGEAILEGETAAGAITEPNARQFYSTVFGGYRQRYAYAQQQLAMQSAQGQAPAAPAAGGSSAIGGTGGTPGMDDKVAAALAAAAGGTPPPATGAPAAGAAAAGAMPGTVAPGAAQAVQPGVQAGYPAQAQPGYPTQAQPGYPAQAQPGYPAQAQPGYPAQAQPGYPAGAPMAPAPVAPAPAVDESEGTLGLSTNTLLLIGAGVVVIVLIAALSGGKKKKG